MKRHTNNKKLEYAKNTAHILTAINNHVTWLPEKEPNQTDPIYYTYDISCNEDFALHSKFYDWERIFDYFKNHYKAKASLATKIIPLNFLSYDPKKKVRIRFSLMPQKYSTLLEPNTPTILERIKAIDAFVDAGYEVHINFSPIIVTDTWLEDYRELFEYVNDYVDNKDEVFAECIFLTHNYKKHQQNLELGRPGEDLLWTPKTQESKKSQYGGINLRYKRYMKNIYIMQFKKLHQSIIPWNKIRYIF